MQKLTATELNFILESLKYTKRKFEDYPIGKDGYPDYEFKQAKIKEVDSVTEKIRTLLREENAENIRLKSPQKASTTFHQIMKASVKDNPKPTKKKTAKKK